VTTDCIMVSLPGPEVRGMDISTDVVNHLAGEYLTFEKIYALSLTKITYLMKNVIQ
jgi:hypothetical protein